MPDKDKNMIDEDIYDDDEDTQKDKYLTFHLGKEVYGIDIYNVIEIIGIQKITQVPDMPDFVKGVINLRGQIIPVVDVRTRFNMEKREYDEHTCIIVVRVKETIIGVVVDTVNEVSDIPQDAISLPPNICMKKGSQYIKGMGRTDDNVKILLDLNKLLFEEELALLRKG